MAVMSRFSGDVMSVHAICNATTQREWMEACPLNYSGWLERMTKMLFERTQKLNEVK